MPNEPKAAVACRLLSQPVPGRDGFLFISKTPSEEVWACTGVGDDDPGVLQSVLEVSCGTQGLKGSPLSRRYTLWVPGFAKKIS